MNADSPLPTGSSTGRRLGWVVLAATFAALAWRQDRFVARYAVNMLFWDQWDFYQPLFQHLGWWDTFLRQHGPHREGVGLVLTRVIAACGRWNSRWDAFAASDVLIVAGLLALRLAWNCGVRSGLALLAVPLIVFNFHQFEDFVGAAHLAHGAAPILLFLLYGLAWFLRDARGRLLAVGGLTFLLIFTGFGVFVGLVAPLVVGLEAIQAWRSGDRRRALFALLALAAIAAGWVLFLHDYMYIAASQGLGLPRGRWHEYAEFAALMLANFFGLHGTGGGAEVLGFAVLGFLAASAAAHARLLFRRGVAADPRSAVLFSLAAYAVIYCANTAAGRAAGGLAQAPAASRYVTLMIPAGLVLLLEISAVPARRMALGLGLAYVGLLIPATTLLRAEEWESIHWYANGRAAWRAAYLATHDEAKADAQSHFRVYPHPVPERLEFLERNRLNLFAPSERP